MLARWPLTGRAEQLGAIHRHDVAGTAGGVVLYGPAGVGKTRLAEEALSSAERAGRPTARAVGHQSMESIPLGALAHLLPASLIGGLGVGDDERTALYHGARAELRRMAGDGRLVLLVDDLDLLDDTSVAVLVPLVVSRTAFLIGTVRTDRVGRAPSTRLSGLHRDGHLARLDLDPLAPDELGDLLRRALGDPVAGATLDELARLSGGNLQVLAELVRSATERGVLVQDRGSWQLVGDLPTTVALDELVDEHLAGVDATGLAVLELLAVCERFGLADLERRHGLVTLEQLEAGRLVSMVVSGRRTSVRLAHPLYGEVLRARMPPLRRRRIQHELADIVEGHGSRRREDVVQVALWRVESGGRVGGDQLHRAARLALAGHDPQLAIRLIDALPDGDDTDAFARAEVLGEAYHLLGQHDDVERVVSEALQQHELTDPERSALSRRLARTRFSSQRDLEGALAALDEAYALIADAEERGLIQGRRALLLADAGRPAEALEVLDTMVVHRDAAANVEMDTARAVSLLSLGRHDEALAMSRRAAQLQTTLPGWQARRGMSGHLVNEAHALAYSGRYAAARQLVEPAVEQARAANAVGARVWLEITLAEIARDTGRADEAIRRFGVAAAEAAASGQDAAIVWAHVGVAQGHLLLGECGHAAAALARADAVDSPIATSWATRERTRAWLEAALGDLVAARARIHHVLAVVQRDGVRTFESALLNDLVRFGRASEAVDRLSELATVVDGPLVAAHHRHAVAVTAGDADALRAVVDDYEALDVLHFAAEAAAELAELHHQHGDARLAAAAMQRSGELAARAGGLRTPPLARGVGVEPLTAREREVALLAAGGRSSRDISERLHLSSRTVETHLARVYRKLGITTRGELAGALGTGDPP